MARKIVYVNEYHCEPPGREPAPDEQVAWEEEPEKTVQTISAALQEAVRAAYEQLRVVKPDLAAAFGYWVLEPSETLNEIAKKQGLTSKSGVSGRVERAKTSIISRMRALFEPQKVNSELERQKVKAALEWMAEHLEKHE